MFSCLASSTNVIGNSAICSFNFSDCNSIGYNFCRGLLRRVIFPALSIILTTAARVLPSFPLINSSTNAICQFNRLTLSSWTDTTSPTLTTGPCFWLGFRCSRNWVRYSELHLFQKCSSAVFRYLSRLIASFPVCVSPLSWDTGGTESIRRPMTKCEGVRGSSPSWLTYVSDREFSTPIWINSVNNSS